MRLMASRNSPATSWSPATATRVRHGKRVVDHARKSAVVEVKVAAGLSDDRSGLTVMMPASVLIRMLAAAGPVSRNASGA